MLDHHSTRFHSAPSSSISRNAHLAAGSSRDFALFPMQNAKNRHFFSKSIVFLTFSMFSPYYFLAYAREHLFFLSFFPYKVFRFAPRLCLCSAKLFFFYPLFLPSSASSIGFVHLPFSAFKIGLVHLFSVIFAHIPIASTNNGTNEQLFL